MQFQSCRLCRYTEIYILTGSALKGSDFENHVLKSIGSFYAEAHHVKPLGRPYNGPDTKDNIICVCPTCHVLSDYKVIRLEQSQIPNVSSTYIDYHNNEIHGNN